MTVNERIRQDEERAKRSDLIKTWAQEFTNLKKYPKWQNSRCASFHKGKQGKLTILMAFQ
jgi:hypothetical protein